MNPQLINSHIQPVIAPKRCGLTGRVCTCQSIICSECKKEAPICRTTCQIKAQEYKGYYLGLDPLFTCEGCLGYTMEEFIESFYSF